MRSGNEDGQSPVSSLVHPETKFNVSLLIATPVYVIQRYHTLVRPSAALSVSDERSLSLEQRYDSTIVSAVELSVYPLTRFSHAHESEWGRDWALPRRVPFCVTLISSMCLTHALQNQVPQGYKKGDQPRRGFTGALESETFNVKCTLQGPRINRSLIPPLKITKWLVIFFDYSCLANSPLTPQTAGGADDVGNAEEDEP